MNFNGDINDLKEGKYVLSWISANLSSTNFTNYQEAVNEYNNIEVAASLVMSENKLFFNNWINPEQPGPYLPWQPTEPVTQDNCVKSCWKVYTRSVEAAAAGMRIMCKMSPNTRCNLSEIFLLIRKY